MRHPTRSSEYLSSSYMSFLFNEAQACKVPIEHQIRSLCLAIGLVQARINSTGYHQVSKAILKWCDSRIVPMNLVCGFKLLGIPSIATRDDVDCAALVAKNLFVKEKSARDDIMFRYYVSRALLTLLATVLRECDQLDGWESFNIGASTAAFVQAVNLNLNADEPIKGLMHHLDSRMDYLLRHIMKHRHRTYQNNLTYGPVVFS